MENNMIREWLVVVIITLCVGSSVLPSIRGNGESYESISMAIESIQNEPVQITVENDNDIISIQYHMSNFFYETVEIDNTDYRIVRLGEESHSLLRGFPDLPTICRSIIIDDTAKMEIQVMYSNFRDYDDVLVAPSKGSILRSVNPDEVSYVFDEIYDENHFYPDKIAQLHDPYILRDFRGKVVQINPFQYNPVEKTLRFYTDITVEIFPEGIDTVNVFERPGVLSTIDVDFSQIYKRHFINFNILDYSVVEEQGNMLVITYDSFYNTMIPFVQWKNMKGVPTEMVNVSEIGNENAIKTYIEQYYNNQGLTFVLLVGDVDQVPTLTAGYSASDPTYSYIVGSDHYSDVFIGRFSAQNVGQVETQVERSIEYEKYPQTGASWYHKGVGVASDEGPGDDGEMDYEHIRNIRSKLMTYLYTEVDEFYDGSQGGEDASGNPTPSMVSNALNNGRSIVNYCGHGGSTGWSSSGFGNSDVNTLVNDDMLPFVICVACNNGQFDDYDTCFCEAWLRATHNGEPTGAIAASGSSKGMEWDPPMDAQDEMIDLLVETYADNIKHTIGGIHANGCMHMNDEYGSLGYGETDTWHIFGDPSLQIRTNTPSTMNVVHDPFISYGSTTFDIIVVGVENAVCAISHNYNLLGYATTNAVGHATITFDTPLSGIDSVDLVVTGYNNVPYMTSLDVQCMLAVDVDGNGYVLKDPDEETYPLDTSVELTAVADPGWSFANWSGDITGDTNPEIIVMNSNKTVTANFKQTTRISIVPSSQTVEKGETFDVFVWVDSGQPIKGIKFETLYYNASLIHATYDNITNPGGITFDGFFSPLNTVNSTQFGLTAVDNVAGEVQIVWEGATGNHTLNITNNASWVTIEFEAQTTLGTSNLDLDGVEITDPDVNVLPTVINNGNVTVIESDITPPEITEVTVTHSDPKDTDSDYGWENFSCTVTDSDGVDEVKLVLTGDTTTEYPMIKDGDDYYCNITISTADEYTYHIWANDTNRNYNTSISQPFELPLNADVNEDGSVGFVDIMMVAGMWGATGPNGWHRADVDNNGEVGFVDVMMVAGKWGQEW